MAGSGTPAVQPGPARPVKVRLPWTRPGVPRPGGRLHDMAAELDKLAALMPFAQQLGLALDVAGPDRAVTGGAAPG